MKQPKIGSFCSGVGGLDMAVEQFFDAEPAWFFEFDPAPSKVLAHRYPDVPNYGDMTTASWSHLEWVAIMCGGTPCQDLSHIGKRRGMNEGTRSNLWGQMREAIAIMRPEVVVWENVRGAYSACAASEMGQCPGCLGESAEHRPFLRALGRVLGDLSDLGFDAEWVGLPASDVGAPHQRFRVFVVAIRSDVRHEWAGRARNGRHGSAHGGSEAAYAQDGAWGVFDGDHVRAGSIEGGWVENSGRSDLVTQPRSPTIGQLTRSAPAEKAGAHSGSGPVDHRGKRPDIQWGPYERAIRRWEAVLGRPAPSPTEPNRKTGNHRLSAQLTEWMMGWPAGWVTDPAIGLTRDEQIHICGNGVVPQQGFRALEIAHERFAA